MKNNTVIIQILCQADHKEGQGCYTCGGYKILLFQGPVCMTCNRVGWLRPGNHTTYVGKRWRTYDGIEMTQRANGSVCDSCEPAASGT